MKNARKYERKVRGFLKRAKSVEDDRKDGSVATILAGILQAEVADRQAEKAAACLEKEFVDFNELRVAPPKDVVECIGKSYPNVRAKAEMISQVLNAVFRRTSSMDISYMSSMPKRELRRHLLEMGMDRYGSAYAAMMGFGAHAVCVDESLAQTLEMDGYIEPGSDVADVQGFLERVIPQKDSLAAHAFLREYVESRGKALARKRKADAERAAKEEEAARKAHEAAEKAEAERKAMEKREKAREARQKKAKAKAAAKKKAATAAKAARKRDKEAAGKTAKKTTKSKKAAKTPKTRESAAKE